MNYARIILSLDGRIVRLRGRVSSDTFSLISILPLRGLLMPVIFSSIALLTASCNEIDTRVKVAALKPSIQLSQSGGASSVSPILPLVPATPPHLPKPPIGPIMTPAPNPVPVPAPPGPNPVPVPLPPPGPNPFPAPPPVLPPAPNPAPAPVPVPPAPAPSTAPKPTESAEGTAIPPSSQIIDAQGNVWTLSSAATVLENGSPASYSSSVTAILYVTGKIYQQNIAGGWWVWNGVGWDVSNNPRSITTSVVAESSGKCVDVPGGNATSGQWLQQWDCNGTLSQSFTFTPTVDGYYSIATGTGGGNCLDSVSGPFPNGVVQVVQTTCNSNSAAQKWKLILNGDGSYLFQTSDGQKCLNVNGSPNGLLAGAQMITYTCTGNQDEMFRLAGVVGRSL